MQLAEVNLHPLEVNITYGLVENITQFVLSKPAAKRSSVLASAEEKQRFLFDVPR